MGIASILPLAKTQFFDENGVPLAGGSVFMYVPNTSTFKTTWQDSGEMTANTNPIILDAAGECLLWGSGAYRQVVQDALGNTIWDQITSSSPIAGQDISSASAVATNATTLRSLANYFADIINVKDFGAQGNGSTDDTTAIQAAITAIGNGTLFFPAGTYIISSALTIPAQTSPLLQGAGMSATRIVQTSSSASGIIFGNTTSQTMPLGGGVRDMTIDGSTTPISSYSSGVGVTVECANDGFSLNNLLIRGWGNGITIDQSFNGFYTNITVLYNYYNGIAYGSRGGYTAGAGNSFSGLNISNFGSSLGGSPTGIALILSGGEFWTNVDVTSYSTGINIAPGVGQYVDYNFFTNVLADTNTMNGWAINGGSGLIYSTVCTNCWGAYNGDNGLLIEGTGVNGFRWVGGRLRENAQSGAIIQNGATEVAIQSSEITANGRGSTAGTYFGIIAGANVSNFQITDNTIGNFGSAFTAQGTGIYLSSGTSNNIVVTNNISVSPAGGGVAIQNFSTGTNVVISGNTGYNPVGAFTPPSFPATTVAYTNPYGITCRVFIEGGTVASVKIGSTVTGQTSGMFLLGNGESITVTYTGSPSWTWFGL